MTPKPPSDETAKAETNGFHGKKGRTGAPKNNRNGMRHGLKAGQLPKGCEYIETRLNLFRRQLEDAVIATKSEVSLSDAACIQTCLRWERHAALAQRWLNVADTTLKPADKLAFSREIAHASTQRDKALAGLKLDEVAAENVFATLYRRLPSPDDSAGNLEQK